MPYTGRMWINGYNSNQFMSLYVFRIGDGTYNLMGQVHNAYAYTGPGDRILNNYPSLSTLAAAVTAFVEEAGLPWLIIGDLTTLSDQQTAAINFAHLLHFGDGTTGIVGGGTYKTNGYAPWSNFSTAQAGILELLGNTQI